MSSDDSVIVLHQYEERLKDFKSNWSEKESLFLKELQGWMINTMEEDNFPPKETKLKDEFILRFIHFIDGCISKINLKKTEMTTDGIKITMVQWIIFVIKLLDKNQWKPLGTHNYLYSILRLLELCLKFSLDFSLSCTEYHQCIERTTKTLISILILDKSHLPEIRMALNCLGNLLIVFKPMILENVSLIHPSLSHCLELLRMLNSAAFQSPIKTLAKGSNSNNNNTTMVYREDYHELMIRIHTGLINTMDSAKLKAQIVAAMDVISLSSSNTTSSLNESLTCLDIGDPEVSDGTNKSHLPVYFGSLLKCLKAAIKYSPSFFANYWGLFLPSQYSFNDYHLFYMLEKLGPDSIHSSVLVDTIFTILVTNKLLLKNACITEKSSFTSFGQKMGSMIVETHGQLFKMMTQWHLALKETYLGFIRTMEVLLSYCNYALLGSSLLDRVFKALICCIHDEVLQKYREGILSLLYLALTCADKALTKDTRTFFDASFQSLLGSLVPLYSRTDSEAQKRRIVECCSVFCHFSILPLEILEALKQEMNVSSILSSSMVMASILFMSALSKNMGEISPSTIDFICKLVEKSQNGSPAADDVLINAIKLLNTISSDLHKASEASIESVKSFLLENLSHPDDGIKLAVIDVLLYLPTWSVTMIWQKEEKNDELYLLKLLDRLDVMLSKLDHVHVRCKYWQAFSCCLQVLNEGFLLKEIASLGISKLSYNRYIDWIELCTDTLSVKTEKEKVKIFAIRSLSMIFKLMDFEEMVKEAKNVLYIQTTISEYIFNPLHETVFKNQKTLLTFKSLWNLEIALQSFFSNVSIRTLIAAIKDKDTWLAQIYETGLNILTISSNFKVKIHAAKLILCLLPLLKDQSCDKEKLRVLAKREQSQALGFVNPTIVKEGTHSTEDPQNKNMQKYIELLLQELDVLLTIV